MEKLDQFKAFAAQRPYLADRVHAKQTSWQELFETYDIYGPTHTVFNETQAAPNNNDSAGSTNNNTDNASAATSKINWAQLINTISTLDLARISEGLSTVKKVVDIFGNINPQQNNQQHNGNRRPFRRYND